MDTEDTDALDTATQGAATLAAQPVAHTQAERAAMLAVVFAAAQ
jgi:hypothetical protein